MNYTVYKHTNKINGKVYIGITKRSVDARWGKKGIHYMHQAFGRAIRKYGWDNFTHEILYTGLTEIDAKTKEVELIKLYDSRNPLNGYNVTSGGDGCVKYKHTLKTRRKLSEFQKKRNIKGCRNPNYGNGEKIMGSKNPMYKVSPRERMDEETYMSWKKNIGNSVSGSKNPMFGSCRTGELSANKKKTLCVTDGRQFSTGKECCEFYGIPVAGFRMYMSGRAKLPKNFRHLEFKYI